MGPYDPRFDRNHDGILDFNEQMHRMDFYDYINKQGIYEEDEDPDDDDDDDDLFDDDDLDGDDLDFGDGLDDF